MKKILLKISILVVIAWLIGILAQGVGMNEKQALSLTIFSASILGTLFFWDFRLSFAFIGTSVLLLTKTIDLERVIEFSSLEVILFLVGMMVVIGLLKDSGLFAWIVSLILRIPNLTATKFVVFISAISLVMAATVDEVTSIIFIIAAVIEICDYFEVSPLPFLIISVMATNIGSFATVLGNPIGILIASKSGLTFDNFLAKALPLSIICLITVILISLVWFRKAIKHLDKNMKKFGANEILTRLIAVPPERNLRVSFGIFVVMLMLLSQHSRFEVALGLEANIILLVIPLVTSGLVMIWKRRKARKFIERDVEWWTLLFFLLLFVQAGTLKYTGTTVFLAKKIIGLTGNNPNLLVSMILWVSAIGSSILDNVVLVAAFIPVVQGFGALQVNLEPLWWALLFGGCLGGNITMIGSTANIVAVGILEKEEKIKINFFQWLWVGLAVGVITTAIAWFALLFIPYYK